MLCGAPRSCARVRDRSATRRRPRLTGASQAPEPEIEVVESYEDEAYVDCLFRVLVLYLTICMYLSFLMSQGNSEARTKCNKKTASRYSVKERPLEESCIYLSISLYTHRQVGCVKSFKAPSLAVPSCWWRRGGGSQVRVVVLLIAGAVASHPYLVDMNPKHYLSQTRGAC